MAKTLITLVIVGNIVAAFLWLPGFVRPDARAIRDQGMNRPSASISTRPKFPLAAPDRKVAPGWKIKIRQGDNLWSILEAALPDASDEEIAKAVTLTARANDLRDPSELEVGLYLRIPEFPFSTSGKQARFN